MNTYIEPIAVSVIEAARMLGIGETRMRELVQSGAVESRYKGSRRLVSVASLRAYFEGLPTERDEPT